MSPRHHFDSTYSQAIGNQTWPPASPLTPYAGTLEPWTPHHKGLTHTTGADTIRHTRMDMAGQGTTDIPSCPEQVVDPTVNGEGSPSQKKGSFSRELSPRHSLPVPPMTRRDLNPWSPSGKIPQILRPFKSWPKERDHHAPGTDKL